MSIANLNQKKIVVLLGYLVEFGGGFQYALSVIDALNKLKKDKFKLTYILLNKKWVDFINAENNDVVIINEGFFFRFLRKIFYVSDLSILIWRKIAKFLHPIYFTINRLNPDLVVFPSEFHFSFGTSFPSIASIHDLMHRYEKTFKEVGTKKEFLKREKLYRNICKYNSIVLADSNVGKAHILESYEIDESKIKVLPFTVPSYLEDNLGKKDLEKLKTKYSLPDRFIFYPANFWEHKNHSSLLYAVSRLQKENIIVRMVFCGAKKNGYSSIMKLVSKLELQNQVFVLEYVPNEDIVGLYEKATALIMPTFLGPTNIPPIEAFQAGCPVAVSDVYGMREQVGNAALLFNPKSIDEIKDAIKQLWTDDDLRKSLVKNGYEQIKKINRVQFKARYEAILNEIIG